MASVMDGDEDVCPICHLPSSICRGSSGLPSRVVSYRNTQAPRGEGHPRTERRAEAGGAAGKGQHSSTEPKGETRVHTKSCFEQKPTREELTTTSGWNRLDTDYTERERTNGVNLWIFIDDCLGYRPVNDQRLIKDTILCVYCG